DGCNLGTAGGFALTFVDVVAAAMEGAGGIDLELGGVLATTEGVDYGDPFGLIAPGLPTVAPVPAPAMRVRPAVPAVSSEERPEPLPAVHSGPALVAAPPRTAEVAAPVAPPGGGPVAVLPATRRCESTNRGRVSGCS